MIKILAKDDLVAKLTVNVFGFSRGAAAARNFIYEISKEIVPAHYGSVSSTSGAASFVPEKPAHGYLGFYLKKEKVKLNDNFVLEVCFAGLFDTVAKFLMYDDGGAEALNLDAVKNVKYILHLTALDERRSNFSLNKIPVSKTLIEKNLPGVHCDVGGSYNDVVKEEIDKMVFKGSKEDAMAE